MATRKVTANKRTAKSKRPIQISHDQPVVDLKVVEIPNADLRVTEPYRRYIYFTVQAGTTSTAVGIDVPQGKRVFIEYVACRIYITPGQRVTAGIDGGYEIAPFILFSQGRIGSYEIYVASQSMPIQLTRQSNSRNVYFARSAGNGATNVGVFIGGYTENE